jgi:sporulation protein YlmC with PRC-barrel domain
MESRVGLGAPLAEFDNFLRGDEVFFENAGGKCVIDTGSFDRQFRGGWGKLLTRSNMNAKSLTFTGLAVATLGLLAPSHLEARGITIQPAPAIQPGTGAPDKPDSQPNPNPGPGTPGTPGPAVPGNSGADHPSVGPGNSPAPSQGDQTEVPMPVNRASHLIGLTVKNPQNQTLGRIKDVVVDLKNSRVPYVVLEKSGRSHGTGSELAVPLNHFSPSPDRKVLILNADKAQLQSTAGFSGDNLPSMNNPAFAADPEPPRREIFIIPVPVHPDQNNEDDQHDAIPPATKKGPKIESP